MDAWSGTHGVHAGRVDSVAFSKKSLCQYAHANPNKMYRQGICKDVLKALTFMHFILRTCNLEIIRWKESIFFFLQMLEMWPSNTIK